MSPFFGQQVNVFIQSFAQVGAAQNSPTQKPMGNRRDPGRMKIDEAIAGQMLLEQLGEVNAQPEDEPMERPRNYRIATPPQGSRESLRPLARDGYMSPDVNFA